VLQFDLVRFLEAQLSRELGEYPKYSPTITAGSLAHVLVCRVVGGDCISHPAAMSRAPVALHEFATTRLHARPQALCWILDLPELPGCPRPITRIHALPDAFAVNITVAPDRTVALDVKAALLPMRARFEVPAPEA
jgi:hypothetical protein